MAVKQEQGQRVARRVARRGPSRPLVIAGVLAVALVLVVLVAALLRPSRPDTLTTTESVAEIASQAAQAVPAVPVSAAAGGWRPLPPAPLEPRSGQSAVATADEVLLWGGAFDDGFSRRRFLADGAALDPATDAWRPLPDAELVPRTDHAAVWAADRLFVWGGMGQTGFLADGATYDPAEDAWEALPASPLSPRAGAAAVWTGGAVVVVGGADNAGPLSDAARYDPETGDWSPLPPLPEGFAEADEVRAVEQDQAVVAWTLDRGGLGATRIARLDAAGGAWTELPAPPVADAGIPQLVAAPGALQALRTSYDGTRADLLTLADGASAWEERPAPAVLADPWAARMWWTGSALLAADADSGVRYDPATDSWSELTEVPPATSPEPPVWTGQDLLRAEPGAQGAAWRPAAR